MGFFSWNCVDSEDSILNTSTGKHETVYLLQPNGKNIREDEYAGYGEFGEIDAFDWLADKNISKEILARAAALNIEKRLLGIYLDSKYYIDTRNGKKYSYVFSKLFDELNKFVDYGVKVDGVKVNDLIKTSVWVEMPMSDYLGEIKKPLKFSYNKDADYALLSASEVAENQGYVIEEEEENY